MSPNKPLCPPIPTGSGVQEREAQIGSTLNPAVVKLGQHKQHPGVLVGAQHPLDPLSTSNSGGVKNTPLPLPFSFLPCPAQRCNRQTCIYTHVNIHMHVNIHVCVPRACPPLPCSSWPPSYPVSWQSGPAPQQGPCSRLPAPGGNPKAELGTASMGGYRQGREREAGWEGAGRKGKKRGRRRERKQKGGGAVPASHQPLPGGRNNTGKG